MTILEPGTEIRGPENSSKDSKNLEKRFEPSSESEVGSERDGKALNVPVHIKVSSEDILSTLHPTLRKIKLYSLSFLIET